MNAIDVENISLEIGHVKILDDVSFNVGEGRIHALIGNNGAGKTSLLRILLGLTPKYQGQIKLFASTNMSMQRQYVGSVMDSISPDKKKTIGAYLHNVCNMFGTAYKDFETELLSKVGLDSVSKKSISKCSLGMVRRLMIACALASKPKLLILDEPFNGIDPNGMNDMRLLLQQLNAENVTVLITSHVISELLKVANIFTIVNNGKVVDTISAEELINGTDYKLIVRPKDSLKFSHVLKTSMPNIFTQSDSNGTIAIFNQCNLSALFQADEYEIIDKIAMSEEDVLLWKMNVNQ